MVPEKIIPTLRLGLYLVGPTEIMAAIAVTLPAEIGGITLPAADLYWDPCFDAPFGLATALHLAKAPFSPSDLVSRPLRPLS